MRRALRTAAALIRPVALAARSVRPATRLTIVGWHRVDSIGTGLSTHEEEFRRQLDVLDEWGATVLPLDRAVALLTTGDLPERAVALTFDDGYASVLELAWPELRARGLPATLFVVPDFLDGQTRFGWDIGSEHDAHTRLADKTEVLAAAASGMDIGSHTMTHRWLPHLDPVQLEHELLASRSTLVTLLDRPITTLAYPMGGWNAAVRDAAERCGYTIAVTVDRGTSGSSTDPLSLRRAFAPDSAEEFRLQLDGALTWLRPIDTWRCRKGPRW